RSLRPGLDVRVSYLDHVAPSAEDALEELAARGAGEAVVLPTLLTAAFHSKVDLPEVLARARGRSPWLRVHYADTLGPHPLL
ncbi:sirohydrochlorin chelatase, partial [Nocardiopsis halotolerans]|uniref:sirohydrochlorin chelatase n=1 Tax=Nocardiopsis halotolerans TaxID=124252 RepID=UPI000475EACA